LFRVWLSKSSGSFGLVRNGLIMVFKFGVFGWGSVRFPSLFRTRGEGKYRRTIFIDPFRRNDQRNKIARSLRKMLDE